MLEFEQKKKRVHEIHHYVAMESIKDPNMTFVRIALHFMIMIDPGNVNGIRTLRMRLSGEFSR